MAHDSFLNVKENKLCSVLDLGVRVQRKEPKIISLTPDRTKISFTFDKSKGSTLPRASSGSTPNSSTTRSTPVTPSSERKPLTLKLKVPSNLDAKKNPDSCPESRNLQRATSLDQIRKEYDSNESEASSEGGDRDSESRKKESQESQRRDTSVTSESRKSFPDLKVGSENSSETKKSSQLKNKKPQLEEEKENVPKSPPRSKDQQAKEASDIFVSPSKSIDLEHLHKSKMKKSILSPQVGSKFRTLTPLKSSFASRVAFHRSFSDTEAFTKNRKSDLHSQSTIPDSLQGTPNGK